MEPIQKSRSHRSDKNREIETIYLLDNQFYLANPYCLKKIELTGIGYTNRCEPFKELARVYYYEQNSENCFKSREDSIDIEFEDIVHLIQFAPSIKIYPELANNKRFKIEIANSKQLRDTHIMEELFNRHKELGERFKQLAGIVQNDWAEFPPTKENINEYVKFHIELTKEMNDLGKEVIDKEVIDKASKYHK